MKQTVWLQILNVVAFIATLIVNFLSQQAIALGVKLFPNSVGDLGESRAIFFLPAGYVFAIWGIIYLGLLAFVVYQARPSQRDNPIITDIGYWFVLSSLGNIAWLFLFINLFTAASTGAMLLLLFSLVMIYLNLDIGRTRVSRAEKWAVHIPFSIYLGWITVATVSNVAAALYEAGYVTGFLGIGADIWTVIMMGIAVVITLVMIFQRGDIAYALVVMFALMGIYARPFDTPTFQIVSSLNAGLVDTAALVLSIVVAAGILVYLLFTGRRSPQVEGQAV